MNNVPPFELQKNSPTKEDISFTLWVKRNCEDIPEHFKFAARSYEGEVYSRRWENLTSIEGAIRMAELWEIKDYIIEGVRINESKTTWIAAASNQAKENK